MDVIRVKTGFHWKAGPYIFISVREVHWRTGQSAMICGTDEPSL